jgi:hypothetical protein
MIKFIRPRLQNVSHSGFLRKGDRTLTFAGLLLARPGPAPA